METIKSGREFQTVFSNGRRANHPLVRMVFLRQDGFGRGRVAFVAAKRLGNAVYRNRCKRVLREAARLEGLPIAGRDVILFSTNETHDSNPQEVAASLRKLLKKVDA